MKKQETLKELYHYGVDGQKWGERNYQYKDGSYTPNGQRENDGHGRYSNYSGETNSNSSNNTKSSNNSKTVNSSSKTSNKSSNKNTSGNKSDTKYLFGMTDEQVAQAKKIALYTGLAVGTAAGAYAVGYIMTNGHPIARLAATTHTLESGYNEYKWASPVKWDMLSYMDPFKSHDEIGSIALANGFGEFHKFSYLDDSVQNLSQNLMDPDNLIRHVICDQRTNSSPRRLSCWSGSHAYFLSRITGKDYISKDYVNLLDFRELSELYSEKDSFNIFNFSGKKVSSFIGHYGESYKAITEDDAEDFIKTLVNSMKGQSNCGNGDLVGFINAGYHKCTCTHEWNFEINGNNIFMADAWAGERKMVASITDDGSIKYLYRNGGMAWFTKEFKHYNKESIRFYAPQLSQINTAALNQNILAKINEIKQSAIRYETLNSFFIIKKHRKDIL